MNFKEMWHHGVKAAQRWQLNFMGITTEEQLKQAIIDRVVSEKTKTFGKVNISKIKAYFSLESDLDKKIRAAITLLEANGYKVSKP